MIKKIAHIADIHLRKTPTRNEEYIAAFNVLLKSLKEKKPDRIVIVGDIVHDYLSLGTEQSILGRNFIMELSEIARTIIIRGNHDCLKSNLKRKDSIEALISGINTKNISYFNETGFFEDENIVWCVWHHGEKNSNPWKTLEGKRLLKNKDSQKTYIDLFHDPLNGSKTPSGFEFDSDQYYSVSDLKGDFSFLGDIHLMQYLNKEKTKAYSGSLVAQDFSEGDDKFHGYLFWDIRKKSVEEVNVKNNNHKYVNVVVNQSTDFDNLDLKLDNDIKNISLRILWETLSGTRNRENEQKIKTHIKKTHPNVRIFHKNNFIEDDSIRIKEDETIKNIMEQDVQHKIFKEYLNKIGVSEEYINDIIELDKKVFKYINDVDSETHSWDIVKLGATNFMSYEKFDLDWKDLFGLFQITGKNTVGKTTIAFKFIPFMLFGKSLETETRMKFGDIRFINNRNDANFTSGYLVLSVNEKYYGIKKRVDIHKNKLGEVSNVSTKLTYHELSFSDDEMTDENNVDNFDENRKNEIQKQINKIIGSYNNFMRVVLTTSDTLNSVLSSDMSEFTDSLLFDSGLDVFDKKLTIVKKIEKQINEKGRISCDLDLKKEEISRAEATIKSLNDDIDDIEKNELSGVEKDLNTIVNKINTLTKKLHEIDPDIYNLDVDIVKRDIASNEKEVNSNNEMIEGLNETNKLLCEKYDEERLAILEEKRSHHKEEEFNLKIQIRDNERDIDKFKNSIEIIRGHILSFKEEGKKIKDKIIDLKNSKKCSECGQELTEEHKAHIKENIDKLLKSAYEIKNQIIEKEENEIPHFQKKIAQTEKKIVNCEKNITVMNDNMASVLDEIGDLINQKNDVEKRKKNDLKIRELNVENGVLKLEIEKLENKLKEHNNLLKKIEENRETNIDIEKTEIEKQEAERKKERLKNIIQEKKIEINTQKNRIETYNETVAQFKKQVKRDEIFGYYKKCVHRDGIPKQMLVMHIIPKINRVMGELLTETPFNIWLDDTTLRPKIVYRDRPDSIIDCISSSGKERTYSSVVLKFALNQVNVKSKPKMFMLDEIMGKLDDESVEEFVQILHLIKKYMNRVLIVEHNHNVLPDYIIEARLNDNNISEAELIKT